jgi:hypothetical protein
MMEIWKDIVGQEGFYQVSNLGNVRSLDRELLNSKGVRSFRSGKLLKPQKYSNGYLFVNLGARNPNLIHRLVALAFIPNENNLPQVNHIDGDRKNNQCGNLEWVSCGDNHKHSYLNLDRKLHSKSKLVVISKDGVEHTFHGCNSAAKFLNVVAGSVASAVNKNHLCKGWRVRYETCKIERFREFEMAKLPR